MKIDLSRLARLAGEAFSEEPQKNHPQNGTAETLLDTEECKNTTEGKNAPESLLGGLEGVAVLQRRADARRDEKADALEVYRTYQQNIRTAGQLQREIQDGVQLGEGIYSLFLKAVQAISLMTGDKLYYESMRETVKAVYGEGLQEREPLELELAEIEERLEKLRRARERTDSHEEKNIARAIQKHEERAKRIQEQIERGGEATER